MAQAVRCDGVGEGVEVARGRLCRQHHRHRQEVEAVMDRGPGEGSLEMLRLGSLGADM